MSDEPFLGCDGHWSVLCKLSSCVLFLMNKK